MSTGMFASLNRKIVLADSGLMGQSKIKNPPNVRLDSTLSRGSCDFNYEFYKPAKVNLSRILIKDFVTQG